MLNLNLSTALHSVWPSDGLVIDVVRIGRLTYPPSPVLVYKFDVPRIMFVDHDVHISYVSMSFLMERTYSNLGLRFRFDLRFTILEVQE